MASYEQPHYQPQYDQQYLPPSPPAVRSRGNSTASARYIPEAYQPRPQQAPPSHQQSPGYPYPYGLPTSRVSPTTPMSSYRGYPDSPPQHTPLEHTLHPHSASRPPYPTSNTDPYITTASRPIHEAHERRPSHSSQRSRKSHDSHRSHQSHRSRHSSDDGRERDRHSHEHEHTHHQHHHDKREGTHRRHSEYDGKALKRHETHRPTLGDTIYSLFGGLKSYLT
ncbi:hypothetical protein B0A54_17458 [Friedmanniomyces endolithicus]|uniref:Uncharacterized protein n=1 Tax=Friedmanniomyces endolithicus TaxID=329885 RepID=A0A4V5N3U5_9PEZI|nr:hypothetical protein B0A54_17458 [Friedmanniomyces endolithicus]